jgi:hypothetical protein
MNILRSYEKLLNKKPIITKAVTSFCTFGLGDLICQSLEKKENINWKRFLIQASFGFMIGPYFHLQFCKIMPYLFPFNKKFSTVKSVAYDQTVGATLFTTMFFSYLDKFNGKSFDQIKEGLKQKLFPTLKDNWKIWPILMAINFSIVPIQYRVLYANFWGMLWVAYLSYVQNVKSKKLH